MTPDDDDIDHIHKHVVDAAIFLLHLGLSQVKTAAVVLSLETSHCDSAHSLSSLLPRQKCPCARGQDFGRGGVLYVPGWHSLTYSEREFTFFSASMTPPLTRVQANKDARKGEVKRHERVYV